MLLLLILSWIGNKTEKQQSMVVQLFPAVLGARAPEEAVSIHKRVLSLPIFFSSSAVT
jgi:hypothetical protein